MSTKSKELILLYTFFEYCTRKTHLGEKSRKNEQKSTTIAIFHLFFYTMGMIKDSKFWKLESYFIEVYRINPTD